MEVSVYDPYANSDVVEKEFGIILTPKIDKYDIIILAVAHDKLITLDIEKIKIKRVCCLRFEISSGY